MHSAAALSLAILLGLAGTRLNAGTPADSLTFVFGQFKDTTPPSGPGNNNSFPLFGPTFAAAKLADYQVTLLNNATVFGLPRPVDGISLQRNISTVTPDPTGGMIPPSTFNQTTRILLVTEDLGLFGPGATLADWDAPFVLGAGSQATFSQSSSQWRGGNPFNPLGGMQTSVMAWEADVASFSVIPVPEPATWALGTLGAVLVLGASRRRSHA